MKTLATWAMLTVCGIALGWLFFGWGLDQLERSNPGYYQHAYQRDFAQGRNTTTGFGYYDRKRERGR